MCARIFFFCAYAVDPDVENGFKCWRIRETWDFFFGGGALVNTPSHLREFALCYERHPESVRTVPWLRPAGRVPNPEDAVDAPDAVDEFQIDSF